MTELPKNKPNKWLERDDFLEESKTLFESLSEEQKIMVFCHLIQNIYESELVEKRTYRGLIYDKLDLGIEAYVRSFDVGLLDLHNMIQFAVDYKENLQKLLKFLEVDTTNIDIKKLEHDFFYGFRTHSTKEDTNKS